MRAPARPLLLDTVCIDGGYLFLQEERLEMMLRDTAQQLGITKVPPPARARVIACRSRAKRPIPGFAA